MDRHSNRRDFIRLTTAAGGALALSPMLTGCAKGGEDAGEAPSTEVPQKSLEVLILGGTGFIGPHMVREAQARGHEVTIFNRGKTNPQLFPDVEKLVGDRDPEVGDGLESLKGHTWDVVIDNSGYVPRHVRGSAQLLKDSAEFYLFTSTAGVYQAWYDGSWPEGETDEDAPLAPLPEPESEEVGEWYGQLKVLCEQAVQEAFPGAYTISRPGLIIGPGDSTDRFTYYPLRVSKGGEMIAFGNPTDPVQYIDARDLAAFSLHCVEQRFVNVFNTLGPREVFTMGEMLNGSKASIGADTQLTWIPPDFLIEHEVIGEGMEGAMLMPWIPQDGTLAGAAKFSRERAFSNGMTFRPFEEIVRDTLEWFKSLPEDRQAQMRAGLRGGGLEYAPASMDQQMAREAEILKAWHART